MRLPLLFTFFSCIPDMYDINCTDGLYYNAIFNLFITFFILFVERVNPLSIYREIINLSHRAKNVLRIVTRDVTDKLYS